MHELSLVEDIIRIATEQSGGRPLQRIRLQVGELTCVMPDALQFCFDSGKAGTPLQQAELEMAMVPGVARCNQCATEFALDELYQACPCGSFDKTLLQGQELVLQSLEWESENTKSGV